ncbi:MAG: hypothetical protein NTW21_01385 [Verrucomicrobia bacterium]|nr:hypothetical protein [Verrucomicrobiota bacterium]
MNAISKPMLASKCERPDLLPFPVLATPKLDGIRCLKLGGKALTRSFNPISNRFAREWIEANLHDGPDGELMLRGGTFNETTSAIGARDGQPDGTLPDPLPIGPPPATGQRGSRGLPRPALGRSHCHHPPDRGRSQGQRQGGDGGLGDVDGVTAAK